MLSYRHEFHAGNHADVLKHSLLSLLLASLTRKDKPFTYFESHAGAGYYSLGSERARQTDEASGGILKLIEAPDRPEALNPWLDFVSSHLDYDQTYPGSPALALRLSRPMDDLVLMELHPAEIEDLRYNFRQDDRVHIHHRDGLEGLPALCPPANRRGLILMDPSYEGGVDYSASATCLKKIHRRWPEGIFALWYPILGQGKDRSGELKAHLESHPFKGLFSLELMVADPKTQSGMVGSGMLVANPPWKLDQEARQVMPWISQHLEGSNHQAWKFDWLINPS